MWSSRLFWKLTTLCIGLNLAFATGMLLVISHSLQDLIRDQVRLRLRDTAVALRGSIAGQFRDHLSGEQLQQVVARMAPQTGTRLTLIGADGTVLADSDEDPRVMQNHGNRPEVKRAAAEGVGVWERASPTLGSRMYYVALPVLVDQVCVGYVRAAMKIGSIDEKIASIRRPLWLLAAVMGLISAILVCAMVGYAVQPLVELKQAAAAVELGRFVSNRPGADQNELATLGAALKNLRRELADRADQSEKHGDRLAAVLSSMAEGVVVVDGEERVVLANQASKALLGVSSAREVAGLPLQVVASESAFHQAVRAALESGEPQQTEFETRGSAGRVLALRAVRLPGDPCSGAVAVLHDLTELRKLENIRREFAANVSHELKTPLAAIKAYAETLRMGAINDAEHNTSFVERIEEQAERLHQLIVDLLALARVESGREALQIAELPLESLVTPCVARHQQAAVAKQVELVTEPPDQPVSVRADEDALLAILNNLVDNAIKYTPAQGSVTVRWWADGAEAVLEVQDTGIGIAPEDQGRVFERFYRVDKARSRELGSTGLGLSIVKHLTQALGGSVELTSQLDQGSTFRVRLPQA